MRSCGIAEQTIMLAAKAMGHDSHPMIGFMVTAGKAVKPAMPKGGQLALPEEVVQERCAHSTVLFSGELHAGHFLHRATLEGKAGAATDIARLLFVVFLALFVIALVMGRRGTAPPL